MISPRRRSRVYVWAAFVCAIASLPATLSSHHSFTAEFDSKKPVTLTGTLTKLEWMNPHAYLYVDVPDGGAAANWAVELGSPNGLTRLGWRRTTLQVGERITIEGTLARFKPHLANARSVTVVATGQQLGAASSEKTTP